MAGCGPQRSAQADPVLELGSLRIGEPVADVARTFGSGAPARRADFKGVARNVELFRHDTAVLGIGFEGGRVTSFVAYQRLATSDDVRREFALPRSIEPRATNVAIERLTWLGAPVFSPMLPRPPEGWRVPTDFTISTTALQLLIERDGHAASKTSAVNEGWIVDVR